MFCTFIMLPLFNCSTESIQATKGRKYFFSRAGCWPVQMCNVVAERPYKPTRSRITELVLNLC
jgi:hypothetical protein